MLPLDGSIYLGFADDSSSRTEKGQPSVIEDERSSPQIHQTILLTTIGRDTLPNGRDAVEDCMNDMQR